MKNIFLFLLPLVFANLTNCNSTIPSQEPYLTIVCDSVSSGWCAVVFEQENCSGSGENKIVLTSDGYGCTNKQFLNEDVFSNYVYLKLNKKNQIDTITHNSKGLKVINSSLSGLTVEDGTKYTLLQFYIGKEKDIRNKKSNYHLNFAWEKKLKEYCESLGSVQK